MYTVRKLRNLAKKKPVYKSMTAKFMLSACLLLKKGLLLNTNTINSLKEGYNTFNLNEFQRFLDTDDNSKIQQNFKEDDRIYQTFCKQMNSKFLKEVKDPDCQNEFNKYKNLGYDEINILEERMKTYFRYFYKKLTEVNKLNDSKLKGEYALAVLHFYHAIHTKKTFPFVRNQTIFEWKVFEKENSLPYAMNKLKNLL